MANPILNTGTFVSVNSSSITLTFPTTYSGGTAIALIMGHGTSGGTPPGSWTAIGGGQTVVSSGSSRLTHLQLSTDGTEGGTTQAFTFGASERRVGVIIATDGSLGQVSTGGFSASATSINHDTVTTANNDSAILYILTGLESSPILTDYTVAQTELGEAATAQGSNDVVLAVGYENFPTAGTTTTRTSSGPGDAAATLGQKTLSVYVTGGGGSITIDSVSNTNAGEDGTMEVTGDSLTGAASVAVGYNSVDLSITVDDTDTLTYTMPDDGQAFGGSYNFDIDVDGVTDTFSATFNPPTGKQYETLTSDYGSLDADSFLVEAGLSGLVTGDQILLDSLDDQGGTITLDPATGLVSSTTSSAVDWAFEYAIVDASDTYALGTASDWTVYSDTVTMAADTSATPNEGTTAVGTYAATNTSNPDLVYSLSGTDAADFNINSSTGAVTAKVAFDYESKSSYSITVTGTIPGIDSDSQNITINVQDVNESPTDISLSSTNVSEAGGLNAVVGTLGTTDPDSGDSHTYTLVAGTGDTDNASFNISGSSLRCNDPATLGVGSYSVRIQTDDGVSTPFTKAFTINVVAAGVILTPVTTTSILCLMAG